MKKENVLPRVALYVRVSNDEQKISGLSLEAQEERLKKYAKEKGWIIVDSYIDAAKTARKGMNKRSEFLRMIGDVKQNKIDLILFCRLDRWFRSVKDYYKVQEILDAHKCGWKTTDEEYDTTTANGRLYINVKLSIAQNEADMCGERIDVVFDSKIARGTVISGNAPFGYRITSEKRLEIVPEQATIVQDAFSFYVSSNSQRSTITYIREKYGLNWCFATFARMLSEELYIGKYNRNGRINDHFCPPIIPIKQFNLVQQLRKNNVRFIPSGRVYLFTSILKCVHCSHSFVGCAPKGISYYRCNYHFSRKLCINNHSIREEKIEQWLLDNILSALHDYKFGWNLKAAEKKRSSTSSEKAALKRKLTKLKELYVNDLIDINEYKKDYELYNLALNNLSESAPETAPDFTLIENILTSDFHSLYKELSNEDKRRLWRSIVKEIHIDMDQNITAILFY